MHLFDATTGKLLNDGKPWEHKVELNTIALDQVSFAYHFLNTYQHKLELNTIMPVFEYLSNGERCETNAPEQQMALDQVSFACHFLNIYLMGRGVRLIPLNNKWHWTRLALHAIF